VVSNKYPSLPAVSNTFLLQQDLSKLGHSTGSPIREF
jgi:hypothetical protein